MANVGLDLAQANLLMTRYEKKIIECVRRDEGQFNKIPVRPANTDRIEWRLKVAGVTSMGNTLEGARFRRPNAPVTVTSFVGQKYFDAAIQITDAALGIANGSDTNFKAAAEYLISDAMNQALRYREGMHYLDGTGIVGVLGGTVTAGTTTMTVSGYDANTSTRSTDRTSVNAMIWPNGVYDIYSYSGLSYLGSVTVVNQNDPTSSDTLGNFTISSPGFPSGVSSGDLLVWQGSFGLAYEGLSSLIDNDVSGTYQGLTFSSNPQAKVWVSTVSSNGGTPRSLTPSLLYRTQMAAYNRMAGSPVPAGKLEYICNPSMAEQFYNMFNVGVAASAAATSASPSINRITPDTDKVGQASMTFISPFGEMKLNMRYHCPQAVVFGVDYSQLAFRQSKQLGWRPSMSNMFTPSQIAAVRTAQLYEIGQVCVEERRHMIKLSDLTYVTSNSGA